MTFDMLAFSPGREGVTVVTVPGSGSIAVQHIRQTPFLSHQGDHPDQSVLQLYNDPYNDPYGDHYGDPHDWMLTAMSINVMWHWDLPTNSVYSSYVHL